MSNFSSGKQLQFYLDAIKKHGSQRKAALALGINRNTLARRLKQLSADAPGLERAAKASVGQQQNSSLTNTPAPENEYSHVLAKMQEQIAALTHLLAKQSGADSAPVMHEPDVAMPYVRAADSSKNERILLISDLHAPYNHPDAISFLAALEDHYRFDRVICVGDELDYHAMSYHESDPDLLSASDELKAGRKVLHDLEEIFPEVDLVDSNHGSMAYRRQKTAGMPRHLIHSYRDIVFGEWMKEGLERAGKKGRGWVWQPFLSINIPNSTAPLYVAHGLATDARNAVRKVHCNVAQGHYHTEFHIRYEESPYAGPLFGISTGCLIDDHSLAFSYNKTTPGRPAIGCAGIIEGVPKLFPMFRDKKNRWTKVIP